ncbi:MAG: Ig-like domain-containing protein [Bacteroidaceae bacterium]|nr:Ig-like domain-containing protein [Bacteroidaceae bacterium]
MKRKILLACVLLLMPLCKIFATYTATITTMIGSSFTIYPVNDLNVDLSQYNVQNITYEMYYDNIIDNGAFTITPNSNTYNITALRRGTYRMVVTVQYMLKKASSGGYAVPVKDQATYNINVVDITQINMPSTLYLQPGDTYTLTPQILEVGAASELTWASSNMGVAVVNNEGTISVLGVGTTTIRCTAYNGVSAQCIVTVNPIPVTGITLNKSDAEIAVGNRLQLEAAITPETATDKSITWSSTNENVALVSDGGRVFAIGKGFCQIKARANDGSGKQTSCLIEVTEAGSVPSGVRGDMNGDGKVTITDAVKVIDIVLEKQ